MPVLTVKGLSIETFRRKLRLAIGCNQNQIESVQESVLVGLCDQFYAMAECMIQMFVQHAQSARESGGVGFGMAAAEPACTVAH